MASRRLPLLTAAALLLAAGCASSSGDTAGTSATASTPASSAPSSADSSSAPAPSASPSDEEVVTITVSVRDGKVTPKPSRVEVPLGSQVRLQVTSDVDDTLHVHGFEVEEDLEAGRTTTIELQPDQPGLYEVETHETELELLQLAVR